MKPLLINFLFVLTLCLLSVPAGAKIDCTFDGRGNVATINVTFDDDDCVTANFDYTFTMVDGTTSAGTNTEDDGPYGELDFNTWDCCETS